MESAELGRRYAAVAEFVKALEARHSNDRSVAIDLLSNSSDPDALTLHYLAEMDMEQKNWEAASEALRRILGLRGDILRNGLPILVHISDYRLGLCEHNLGQLESGDTRINKVEQLWLDADQDARHLLGSSF